MNWSKTLGIVPISALTTCFGTVAKICVTSWIRSLTATQKCLYEFWCFGSNVVEDSVLWDTAMETSETSFFHVRKTAELWNLYRAIWFSGHIDIQMTGKLPICHLWVGCCPVFEGISRAGTTACYLMKETDGCDCVGYDSYILLTYNSQFSIKFDWNDMLCSTSYTY